MSNPTKVTNILVVDNHPVTISGLKAELLTHNLHHQFAIKYTAINGREGLETLHANPDIEIVVLDIEMDVMDGLQVAEAIRENSDLNHVKIVIYSNYRSRLTAAKALAIGVDAYVIKDSPMQVFMDALLHVRNGMYYLDATLGKINPPKPVVKAADQPLTATEVRVICLIMKQKKDSEIAAALDISPDNVENIKRKIREKTGATNVVGIVLYAIEHNLCKHF